MNEEQFLLSRYDAPMELGFDALEAARAIDARRRADPLIGGPEWLETCYERIVAKLKHAKGIQEFVENFDDPETSVSYKDHLGITWHGKVVALLELRQHYLNEIPGLCASLSEASNELAAIMVALMSTASNQTGALPGGPDQPAPKVAVGSPTTR